MLFDPAIAPPANILIPKVRWTNWNSGENVAAAWLFN
jgi:hypothetical protein